MTDETEASLRNLRVKMCSMCLPECAHIYKALDYFYSHLDKSVLWVAYGHINEQCLGLPDPFTLKD